MPFTTGRSYRNRCPRVPRPEEVIDVDRDLSLYEFVNFGNVKLIATWLTEYARRHSFRYASLDRVVIVNMREDAYTVENVDALKKALVDEGVSSLIFFLYYKQVIDGVTSAHILTCFYDEGRLRLADSNGPDERRLLHMRRVCSMVRLVLRSMMPDITVDHLAVPTLNISETALTRKMDRVVGISSPDDTLVKGMCSPWALTLYIDMMCAPLRFTVDEHYDRLLSGIVDDDMDPETRRYFVLLYLRGMMTWMAARMREDDYGLLSGWKGSELKKTSPRLGFYSKEGMMEDIREGRRPHLVDSR